MKFRYKTWDIQAYFCSRTGVFYGEVLNAPELIAFQAQSESDLKACARYAIEQSVNFTLSHIPQF